MCGRYTLTKPLKDIVTHYNPAHVKTIHEARYNIAPSQTAPIVIAESGALELHSMRWGLIPSWSRDKKTGSGLINARSETIDQKPSFRSSFKSKRCLVPADGYIEWEKTAKGKIPHYIYLPANEIFSFAGIWSEYQGEKESVRTFSIITAEASPQIHSLHPRMPILLPPDQYQNWLSSDADVEDLKKTMDSFMTCPLETREISRKINSPANDFAECLITDPEH